MVAGADGQVAVDQEGEAAEHVFLGQAWLGVNVVAHAVGEVLVVGHAVSICSAAAAGACAAGGEAGVRRGGWRWGAVDTVIG